MFVQWRDLTPAAAILVVCAWGVPPAQATKFLVGDAEVALSGVVGAGTSIRTRSPDPSLIPVGNAAAAGTPGTAPVGRNQDDGNLNFRRGDPVSTVVKALT